MKKGFTTIPDWMLDLDLDVYETIVLAVIYGFSQDGSSTFTGSQNFLAKKAKCTRRKITLVLPHLVKLGYIVKVEKDVRGVKLCEYKVCTTFTGCECDSQGGCECGSHNNIDSNIVINNSLSNTRTREKFTKPTIEEIADYCRERNNGIDAVAFYNFYESKGWKVGSALMKDWRAAVVTWEQRRKNEPKAPTGRTPQPPYHKETTLEHNLKVYDQLAGTNLYEHYYGNHEQTNEDYDEQ